MDPVDLEQLLYELRSSTAEKITVPAEKITPGCVIAEGFWERHVVTAKATPLHHDLLQVPVRHLHGGHQILRRWTKGESVTIYRHRLATVSEFTVPVVPRCFVPQDPERGDRVVMQQHTVDRLGEGRFFEYDGSQWLQVTDTFDGRRVRSTVRTYDSIRHLVSDPQESAPDGWFVYLPAGHRPHLYVDGRPLPARTAAELAVGDVIRLPGRGRLEVTAHTTTSDSTALTLRVLDSSRHVLKHLVWGSIPGDVIEHHDSGRTRSLYPTEPRPDELLTALHLGHGDTVIASWSAPYSAVSVVEDVLEQPLRNAAHVYTTGVDGRPRHTSTGLDNRFVLLHRPADVHQFAAVPRPLARARA